MSNPAKVLFHVRRETILEWTFSMHVPLPASSGSPPAFWFAGSPAWVTFTCSSQTPLPFGHYTPWVIPAGSALCWGRHGDIKLICAALVATWRSNTDLLLSLNESTALDTLGSVLGSAHCLGFVHLLKSLTIPLDWSSSPSFYPSSSTPFSWFLLLSFWFVTPGPRLVSWNLHFSPRPRFV